MKQENLLETCSLLTKVEHLGIYCFRKGFVLIINAQREINDLATSSFYESNPTFRKPRVTFPAPTNSLEQKLFLCMDRFFRAIFLQQSWSSKAMKAEKTTNYDDKTTLCECCIRLNFILSCPDKNYNTLFASMAFSRLCGRAWFSYDVWNGWKSFTEFYCFVRPKR